MEGVTKLPSRVVVPFPTGVFKPEWGNLYFKAFSESKRFRRS